MQGQLRGQVAGVRDGKGAASLADGNGGASQGPGHGCTTPRPHGGRTAFSQLSLYPSLPSALQGPELWPEENLGDQELAAVLVSWMGPLILRLSHALERSPTPWFQQTPCLP